MPSMNIFDNDAFTMTSLSAAISAVPFHPTRLLDLGLFEFVPVATTSVWFEMLGDTLRMVRAGVRGAPGETVGRDRRRAVGFKTIHLNRQDTILADEVQNVRAFGSETELETVMARLNQIIAKHRRDIETTIEHLRIGAIKGQILDSDGSTVLEDLFDKFSVVQQTHDMNLDSDTTDIRTEVVKAKRKSEDVLGGSPLRGFRVFCGDTFFDDLIGHPELKAAYDRWMEGELLRNDPRAGFAFGGAIWENYRGSVGGTSFIGTNDAYMVPEGVPGLFIENYAPGSFNGLENTLGKQFYMQVVENHFKTGYDMQLESNPLAICTRPRAVIKLTRT